MKKSLPFLIPTIFALVSTPIQAQSSLRGGFVENADVFMYMDVAKMNQSPFSKAVKAEESAEDKALAEEKAAKFTAATGLTEEDVLSVAFSMDIDNIDFQANDPDQLEDAQTVLAIDLAKPITLEKAKAGIEAMSEEGEMKADLSIEAVDGLQVIKLTSKKNAEQGPDQAFGTLTPDGKTFLMSFNTASLKDGLTRIAESKTAAPTADMAAAMQSMGNRNARMVLVLPPAARQKIQEGIQAAGAQGGMGAMMMPFATSKSLLISANTAENLDFYLSLDLGNPGNAQQAAGMVQGMLPMMMMSMGPQAMELSQKVKIAPQDSVVTLSLNLTPADIKKLKDASQGNGAPMGEMNMEMQ